jgi:hypothetical protein
LLATFKLIIAVIVLNCLVFKSKDWLLVCFFNKLIFESPDLKRRDVIACDAAVYGRRTGGATRERGRNNLKLDFAGVVGGAINHLIV